MQVERESIQLEREQVLPLVTRVVPIEYSNTGELGEDGKNIEGIVNSFYLANALNTPPGDYNRKIETQRN